MKISFRRLLLPALCLLILSGLAFGEPAAPIGYSLDPFGGTSINRRSGSTLSKPQPSGWTSKGLTPLPVISLLIFLSWLHSPLNHI